MAITNGYCSLAELKARIDVTDVDATRDDILERCIETASREIDAVTGDLFYSITASTFTFDAEYTDYLIVSPGLRTVTTLKTDDDGDRVYETTWATTDYDLEPASAATFGLPYTAVRVTPNGTHSFPRGMRRGVQIVGNWGWATLPANIKMACLIGAHRLVKRQDSPLGVVQAIADAPATQLRRADPDWFDLIAPYRRFGVLAV